MHAQNNDFIASASQSLYESNADEVTREKCRTRENYREYPKVCVNLQTDVRYNYSVWRLFLWQEEKTAHKKQQ